MSGIPFGYIEKFDGVSLNTANIKPMRCRLKGAPTARILTLVNGTAVNIDGTAGSSGRFPVEQVLEILIHGTGPGTGLQVDTLLWQVTSKAGDQGVLEIHVPGHFENYYCEAQFDYAEIVSEGNMRDNSGTNWTVVKLVFQQMDEFY